MVSVTATTPSKVRFHDHDTGVPDDRSATYDLSISAVRADALFASALQRSEEPSAGQVRQAIAAAIRAYGDLGCAARVAQAYGEHPETAVTRMRWARTSVAAAFGGSEPERPRAPKLSQCTSRAARATTTYQMSSMTQSITHPGRPFSTAALGGHP